MNQKREDLSNGEPSSEQLKTEVEELRTRIDGVLFYKWDPIGFSDANGPRDEYSSYVEPILEMMLEGAPADSLAEHLSYICTRIIGIRGDRNNDKTVAKLIHAIVNDTFYYPGHTVISVDE